ncbi:hypothetical protein CJ030_MR1G018613 [Morella rubra]|uniref:Uncharacterized protein n=1 Tax=Morella rubra TaxID=262757 RepID=A0A6A1WK29_9ROSI|nr:hypothetical protein CJ030_MR1G018613 [Morella rubra]
MIPLTLHQPLPFHSISQTTPFHLSRTPPQFPTPPFSPLLHKSNPFTTLKFFGVSKAEALITGDGGYTKASTEIEDLSPNGAVYRKTLALVECSMFAALTGLVYFLSNSLAIEVATTMLLLVLSGPVKALTYLLKHGIVGFTMGTLWSCLAVQVQACFVFIPVLMITINIHASLTFMFTASGLNTIPSMNAIYTLFAVLAWYEVLIAVAKVDREGDIISC